MYKVLIAGVEFALIIDSLNLSEGINNPFGLDFSIRTNETIVAGQPVELYKGEELLFGGTVDSFTLSYIRGDGSDGRARRVYQVKALDNNSLLDKRLVGEIYENKTISFVVGDIVDKYLTQEGITLGSVSSGSLLVRQAVFNYITPGDCFRYIKDLSGLNFRVDKNKVLTLFLDQENKGEDITDETANEIIITESRDDYRNAQYIRATDATTALQNKERPTPNPDGVSTTFFLRFPIATKPQIFINDIEVDPAEIGINGLEQGKEWYWNKGNNGITQDTSLPPLQSSDKIEVSYRGIRTLLIRTENASEIANRSALEQNSGIYERIETQANITEREAITEYADGLLRKYGVIPRWANVVTEQDISAGQIVRINSEQLGINDNFLVTEKSSYIDSVGDMISTLRCASGEDVGGWEEFFRNIVPSGNLVIRGNEVLIRSLSEQEDHFMQGEYSLAKTLLRFPAENLFPGNTLVPGGVILEVSIFD